MLAVVLALAGVAALAAVETAPESSAPRYYSLTYEVRFVPMEGKAQVSIQLGKEAHLVRAIDLITDPLRHQHFEGDGRLEAFPGGVRWLPPRNGGELHYTFWFDHRQENTQSYDSHWTSKWALFRGDDLVPPARVRALKGAESHARLRLKLPPKWSAALPYLREADGSYAIDHPQRRFDRPTGWMVAAERLGVLRERVAGTDLVIAGPVAQGLRRQDMLAFLRWTLPVLGNTLKQLPDRILIVGANDPMWKGGLSGPNSLYIHADRPLITSLGTSPLLHEIIHTVMGARAGRGGDWIVEGLAEFYSLEMLVRSATVSHKRYHKVLAKLEKRGRRAKKLRVHSSSGAVTARAVSLLYKLDQQIREGTSGKISLDDVFREMVKSPQAWTTKSFQQICEQVAGMNLDAFFGRWISKPSKPPPSPR